ncbi:MAG: hypothetical protein AAF840_05720 [Bacteroidota bacterium]
MTNDRLFGLFLRVITVPLILIIVGIGGLALFSFCERELIAKEMYQWEPVLATDYQFSGTAAEGDLVFTYTYTYEGVDYQRETISPFKVLNLRARQSETFRKWALREDHPLLTVYVDASSPERSSIVRGWPQDDRIQSLVTGGGLFTVGLALLYFSLRRVPRVEKLF